MVAPRQLAPSVGTTSVGSTGSVASQLDDLRLIGSKRVDLLRLLRLHAALAGDDAFLQHPPRGPGRDVRRVQLPPHSGGDLASPGADPICIGGAGTIIGCPGARVPLVRRVVGGPDAIPAEIYCSDCDAYHAADAGESGRSTTPSGPSDPIWPITGPATTPRTLRHSCAPSSRAVPPTGRKPAKQRAPPSTSRRRPGTWRWPP